MPSIVDVPGVGLVIYEQVPASDTTSQQRTVYIEGYGNVLVVPVRPDDTRTPRQRCIDEAKKRADKEESEASDWLPRIKNVSVCVEDKFNNILFEEVAIDR